VKMDLSPSPFLLLISGPSGAGKSSVYLPLMEKDASLRFSVSCTTRPPRPGEVDGREYHFLSREEFLRQVDQGRFVEHFTVHDQLYGTRRADLDEMLAEGHTPVLDLDVQGGMRILSAYGDQVVSVFLFPPSWEELERRLRRRRTEDEQEIRLRLENAHRELRWADHYGYWVVNEVLEQAIDDLRAIVRAERLRRTRWPRPPLESSGRER